MQAAADCSQVPGWVLGSEGLSQRGDVALWASHLSCDKARLLLPIDVSEVWAASGLSESGVCTEARELQKSLLAAGCLPLDCN